MRLSSIRIDYVEDFASSSSQTKSSERIKAKNFEEITLVLLGVLSELL